jgi:hypothetical protein
MAAKIKRATLGEVFDELKANADFPFFSKSDQNAIIRGAMIACAEMWIDRYLPTRFTGKARRLGWTVTPRWGRKKLARGGQAVNPLIWSGDLAVSALSGAKIKRVISKGGFTGTHSVTISIPYPGPRHSIVGTVLRHELPPEEQDQLQVLFRDTIEKLMSGRTVARTGGRKAGRYALSMEARAYGAARYRKTGTSARAVGVGA